MNIDCPKCSRRDWHYHCRHCERALNQSVAQCPECGIPRPKAQEN